ncbi:MAG TPA: cytochrome c [Thermomicrobiales bacterium]|nr:cytochrome c [Thermomicrobiales bacterium]
MAVHRRFVLLVSLISVALGAAACGRATEDQINQALGITPTATQSAEQVAAATEAASATVAARQLAATSPEAGALGDVTQGSRQFQTWCSGCHGPGGQGPDIRSPGSPGETVTAESLLALVREGVGHPEPPNPPGVYRTTEISDKQVADLAAYLRDQSAE